MDQLVDGDDVLAAGLAYTRGLLAAGTAVRRTRDMEIVDKAAALAELDALAADTAKKARGLMAHHAILNRITDPAELTGFDLEGYAWAEAASSPDRLVFRRKMAG